MKKVLYLILLSFFVQACDKEKLFDGPDTYADSFENYAVLEELLQPQDSFWSFTQVTLPGNNIFVDDSMAHSGQQSLRFEASGTESNLSKCSIAKQKMAFWEGETMRIRVWYYIAGTKELQWLFLLDQEEQSVIGAGPGMRLALVDNRLRIEHKFNEPDIPQAAGQELDFPRDQWVEIVWETTLSQRKKGSTRVWQDGQLIIEAENRRTLPEDLLYFQQGTKGMYSSVEIGVTANPSEDAVMLWVDDFEVEQVP